MMSSQQTDDTDAHDARSLLRRASAFLRKLVGPKLFTIHATLIIALRITCYGYFSGILTTLERRFQLSSSEAGTLFIVNDIAELSFIVIVSHFGHKSHRPRWIALGAVVMGVGMLICAIPHFSSSPLDPDAVRLGLNRGYDDGQGGNLDSLQLCSVDQYGNNGDGKVVNNSFLKKNYTDFSYNYDTDPFIYQLHINWFYSNHAWLYLS